MNDHKRLIQVLESTIKDGKSLIVDYEISIAEMEDQLQETRARLVITQTAQVALVEKLHELNKLQRDTAERILNMFDQPDSATCYSVAYLTEEVYGVVTPHNLKKCCMRLYDLQRRGKVVFNRPISAATTVERTCE